MNLTPLGNRVIVQRDEASGDRTTASGLFIPDIAQEKPQTATVVAVGPGALRDDGTGYHNMHVLPGNKVMLGKYSGYDVTIEGAVYTVLVETDILGVFND